ASWVTTARKAIQSSKTPFLKAANQSGNGFLGFPARCFRGIRQRFSCFKSEQGNGSLRAVQAFTRSLANAYKLATFSIRQRAKGLRNGVGHTGILKESFHGSEVFLFPLSMSQPDRTWQVTH